MTKMQRSILSFLPTLIISLLPACVSATIDGQSVGRPAHGLVGYGITMYSPLCAYTCKNTLPTYLVCPNSTVSDSSSDDDGMSMITLMDMSGNDNTTTSSSSTNSTWSGTPTMSPTASCIASNTPYLQSIAYCMSTHCPNSTTVAQREAWWSANLVSTLGDQPEPIMSYQEALASMGGAVPTQGMNASVPMEGAVLVDEGTFEAENNAEVNFQRGEIWHSATSLVIATTCVGIPILISLLRFLPLSSNSIRKIHTSFIQAPLVARPIYVPILSTLASMQRGHFLLSSYVVAINTMMCSIGYRSVSPNVWFDTRTLELATYIANRAGVLSFVNLPLLFLYAGRNNFLLWLTGWSQATFVLLHKVVAGVATLEACLHSAIYLQIKLADGTHASESKLPYWYMGIIGTLAMVIILPLSVRAFRVVAYEVFLVGHILLSIATLVGCWYHIVWRFENQWGYEVWLYCAMAVWGFDRIARWLRVALVGWKSAYVTRIDEDYLRIDIPGVAMQGHAYVYFPFISMPRFWENHPFSIAAVNRWSPEDHHHHLSLAPADSSLEKVKSEGSTSTTPQLPTQATTTRPLSTTIIVRVLDGSTRKLANEMARVGPRRPIQCLMEGPYGHAAHAPGSYEVASQPFDNIVFIAGGVGITALLPSLSIASQSSRGSVKLYWSSRSAALVHAIESLVSNGQTSSPWGNVITDVKVGPRLDLEVILRSELGLGSALVVTCGPAGMMKEVRYLVSSMAEAGARVGLVEESFDW